MYLHTRSADPTSAERVTGQHTSDEKRCAESDTRSLQVEIVDVDEYVISQVHVGQPVQVTVDALGNSTLDGIVSGVSLLPQPAASGEQTYPVIISVSAVPPDVRAGMSVRVVLRD
jgi:multidrug resistance efflux pump